MTDAIRARDAAVDWQNPGDIDLWQALEDRHDVLAALDERVMELNRLGETARDWHDQLTAAVEREARLRAAAERLLARLDSEPSVDGMRVVSRADDVVRRLRVALDPDANVWAYLDDAALATEADDA